MGAWGFILLAYGTVWFALVLYLVLLKRRLKRAAAELLRRSGEQSVGSAGTEFVK